MNSTDAPAPVSAASHQACGAMPRAAPSILFLRRAACPVGLRLARFLRHTAPAVAALHLWFEIAAFDEERDVFRCEIGQAKVVMSGSSSLTFNCAVACGAALTLKRWKFS